MSQIHVRENGGPGEYVVEVSALIRWVAGVSAVVSAGLVIAAITGNIAMYRQVGELSRSLDALTNTLESEKIRSLKLDEDSMVEMEKIKMTQEQIKARITALDRRLNW